MNPRSHRQVNPSESRRSFSKRFRLLCRSLMTSPSAFILVFATAPAECTTTTARIGRRFVSLQLAKRIKYSIRPNSKPAEFLASRSVDFAESITEGQAGAVVLWNDTASQEALSKLGLSRADLLQAEMFSNPTFSILFLMPAFYARFGRSRAKPKTGNGVRHLQRHPANS